MGSSESSELWGSCFPHFSRGKICINKRMNTNEYLQHSHRMIQWRKGDGTAQPLEPHYYTKAFQWNLIEEISTASLMIAPKKRRILRGHGPEGEA